MREKRHLESMFLTAALVAMVTVATGCGGGGSSLSYSGKETPAQVGDSAAALTYLTSGYGVFDAVSVVAGTVVGPAWSAPAALSADAMTTRIATIEYSSTVYGVHDGSFNLDWLVNTFSGNFAGSISYEGYSDLPGDSVTGNADAEGTGFNEDAPPGEVGLTFSSLAVSKWGAGWKVSGGMSVENFSAAQQGIAQPLVFLADSTIVIEEMILKSPEDITMKLEGANIDVDLGVGQYWYNIHGFGGRGARLYHPSYGYLYIATIEPVEIDGESGHPNRGVIRITDEVDNFAWLWMDSQGETRPWAVWLDGGNGVLDYGMGDGADDTRVLNGLFVDGVFTVSTPG